MPALGSPSHTVDSTMVSPQRTMTAPPACLAICPVSIDRVWLAEGHFARRSISSLALRSPPAAALADTPANRTERACTDARRPSSRAASPLASIQVKSIYLRMPSLLDQNRDTRVQVLALQVVEQPTALSDQLQQAADANDGPSGGT